MKPLKLWSYRSIAAGNRSGVISDNWSLFITSSSEMNSGIPLTWTKQEQMRHYYFSKKFTHIYLHIWQKFSLMIISYHFYCISTIVIYILEKVLNNNRNKNIPLENKKWNFRLSLYSSTLRTSYLSQKKT